MLDAGDHFPEGWLVESEFFQLGRVPALRLFGQGGEFFEHLLDFAEGEAHLVQRQRRALHVTARNLPFQPVVKPHEVRFIGVLPFAGIAQNVLGLHEPLFDVRSQCQDPRDSERRTQRDRLERSFSFLKDAHIFLLFFYLEHGKSSDVLEVRINEIGSRADLLSSLCNLYRRGLFFFLLFFGEFLGEFLQHILRHPFGVLRFFF